MGLEAVKTHQSFSRMWCGAGETFSFIPKHVGLRAVEIIQHAPAYVDWSLGKLKDWSKTCVGLEAIEEIQHFDGLWSLGESLRTGPKHVGSEAVETTQ
jgi:hypothetical protein